MQRSSKLFAVLALAMSSFSSAACGGGDGQVVGQSRQQICDAENARAQALGVPLDEAVRASCSSAGNGNGMLPDDGAGNVIF